MATQILQFNDVAIFLNFVGIAGKTTITVVENLSPPNGTKPPELQPSVFPNDSVAKGNFSDGIPVTSAPVTLTLPPSTFILAPIQPQPQPCFTRLTLPSPFVQIHQPILSKMCVPSSNLQKIPIAVIRKPVRRKIRKPRTKKPPKTKAIVVEENEGRTIANDDSTTSIQPDLRPDSPKAVECHEKTDTLPNVDTVSTSQVQKTSDASSTTQLDEIRQPAHNTAPTLEEIPIGNAQSPQTTPVIEEGIKTTDSIKSTKEAGTEPSPLNSSINPKTSETVSVEHAAETTELETKIVELESTKSVVDCNSEPNTTSIVDQATEKTSSPLRMASTSETPKKNVDICSDSVRPSLVEEDISQALPSRPTFDVIRSRGLNNDSQLVEDSISLASEKISECIARSIGLIESSEEADTDIMELGTDWGDVVGVGHPHSPKSPISPTTTMFLSIFPLLPKESMSVPADGQTQVHPTQKNLGSNCRSSFFIDSMLPDENAHHMSPLPSISFDSLTRNAIKSTIGQENKNRSSSDSLDTILAPLTNLRDKRSAEMTSLSSYLNLNEHMESNSKERVVKIASSAAPAHVSHTLTSLLPVTHASNNFYQNQPTTGALFFPNYAQAGAGDHDSTHQQIHTTNFNLDSNTSQLPLPTNSFSPNSFRPKFTDLGRLPVSSAQKRGSGSPRKASAIGKVSKVGDHSRNPAQSGGSFSDNFIVHQPQFKPAQASHHHLHSNKQQSQSQSHAPTMPFQNQNLRCGLNSTQSYANAFDLAQKTHSSKAVASNSQNNHVLQRSVQQTSPIQQRTFPPPIPQQPHHAFVGQYGSQSFYPPPPKTTPFYLSQPNYAARLNPPESQPPFPPKQSNTGSNPQFPHLDFYNAPPAPEETRTPHFRTQTQPSRRQDYVQPAPSPHYGSGIPQITQPAQGPKKSASNFGVSSQNVSAQHGVRQRPVNWMTDPPFKKVSHENTNTNPFSVSKLVGVQSSPGAQAQHTNYCAEALIRQDSNPWNEFQYRPTPQPSTGSYGCQSTGQNENNAERRDFRQNQEQQQYDGNNFYHFQTPQPQAIQHHQDLPNQFPHTHQATSSISNFNLSSIFPEINDKAQRQQVKSNSNFNNYFINANRK